MVMSIERNKPITHSRRGDLLFGPDLKRSEEERTADLYYFDLQRVAKKEGLNTFDIDDEVSKRLEVIEKRLNIKEMRKGLPVRVRESANSTVKVAGAFYSEFIKPWVATGNDAYKPTEEDITHFCERAANGIGVNLVQYYALSKTQSPSRTGSPDTKIDYAEFEMLRYQAVMGRVAKEIGLNINFTIVDETDILPEDPYLGFNNSDSKVNRLIATRYLEEQGVSDRIRIRSLRDSIALPIGDEFHAAYEDQLILSKDKTAGLLKEPRQNNALMRRIYTLLDCIPDSGLIAQGVDPDAIDYIRKSAMSGDFGSLPQETLQYLTGLTTHIDAMMALRGKAKQAVQEKGLTAEYPEYQDESRVYGGVTRSTHRWSFLPHPTKFMGRTVNPMHGIAGYGSNNDYVGNIPFNVLQEMQNVCEAQLVYLDNKPMLGRIRNNK